MATYYISPNSIDSGLAGPVWRRVRLQLTRAKRPGNQQYQRPQISGKEGSCPETVINLCEARDLHLRPLWRVKQWIYSNGEAAQSVQSYFSPPTKPILHLLIYNHLSKKYNNHKKKKLDLSLGLRKQEYVRANGGAGANRAITLLRRAARNHRNQAIHRSSRELHSLLMRVHHGLMAAISSLGWKM